MGDTEYACERSLFDLGSTGCEHLCLFFVYDAFFRRGFQSRFRAVFMSVVNRRRTSCKERLMMGIFLIWHMDDTRQLLERIESA